MQAEVDSPTVPRRAVDQGAGGVLDPAKLAVGLLGAALRAGVRVHEHTPATAIDGAPDASSCGPRGAAR